MCVLCVRARAIISLHREPRGISMSSLSTNSSDILLDRVFDTVNGTGISSRNECTSYMTLAHLFVHVKRHVRALHTFRGDSIDFVVVVYVNWLSLLCSTHSFSSLKYFQWRISFSLFTT